VFSGSIAPLLAVVGLLAVLWGLALLMRGTGRRARRGTIAVLAVGGAGMLLGGTAFAAPALPAVDGGAGSASLSVAAAPTPRPTASAPSASAALDALAVKGRAPMTGYQRVKRFGRAWADVDRNGCDTRDDVLRRDLTHVTGGSCKVRSGVLHDPYTGTTIHFLRGERTSEAVQIDHVVPLADAWRTGAQRLTKTQRTALANDPVNLFAVDGPTNTRKSDGDAATWLPPVKSFRCTYVAHQIAVKRAYSLWVTKAEKAAMQRVLARCPDQRLPVATASSAPAPSKAAVVHPGSLCAPAGATGRTAAGTAMTCRTSATDERARWRRAA
jgi:hypothetical protein